MDSDRLLHSLAVARKMVDIGKKMNLENKQLKELFLLGFNHDIGYEYAENGINHNVIGSDMLKENNYDYYNEVYYHGQVDSNYSSLYLDILNSADMQIDRYGNDVGFNKRLEDIMKRYGKDSGVYLRCKKLINSIKDKGIY